MKTLLCVCINVFVVITSLSAQGEEALIKKVKAKADKVDNYTAQGKMKIDVSFIDAPDSKVTVYYKRPEKFRIIKEGGVSIMPKGGIGVNMSALLSTEKYDVVPGKDVLLNGTKLRVVKLLPQDDNGDIILTTLYIEEKNLVVKKAVVATRENGSYEIELTYGKYIEWGLPDKVIFSFNTKDYKLPKGIAFEYEKGTQKKPEAPKNRQGKVEITYAGYTINKGIDEKVFVN